MSVLLTQFGIAESRMAPYIPRMRNILVLVALLLVAACATQESIASNDCHGRVGPQGRATPLQAEATCR
jgi:hypothetical protein